MSDRLVVRVDSTILNSMVLCPERWHFEHFDHWRPQRKSMALERGVLMHKMLEHFYKEKYKGRSKPSDMPMLVEECLMVGRVFATQTANISAEEFQEDIRVFKEYYLRWQFDGWEVVNVESPFSKPLYDSPKLLILYEGVIDLIVKDPKLGEIVVDTKTESRESNPFELSNQFQAYQYLTGHPLIINKIGYQKAAKLEDVIEDGQRKRLDMRFRRIYQNCGEESLKEWREDAIRTVIDSIGWTKDIMNGKRLFKNRTSCDKWGGCIFQKVCKEPSEVRLHILKREFYQDKPWDPYDRDGSEAVSDEAVL